MTIRATLAALFLMTGMAMADPAPDPSESDPGHQVSPTGDANGAVTRQAFEARFDASAMEILAARPGVRADRFAAFDIARPRDAEEWKRLNSGGRAVTECFRTPARQGLSRKSGRQPGGAAAAGFCQPDIGAGLASGQGLRPKSDGRILSGSGKRAGPQCDVQMRFCQKPAGFCAVERADSVERRARGAIRHRRASSCCCPGHRGAGVSRVRCCADGRRQVILGKPRADTLPLSAIAAKVAFDLNGSRI